MQDDMCGDRREQITALSRYNIFLILLGYFNFHITVEPRGSRKNLNNLNMLKFILTDKNYYIFMVQ